MFSLITSMKLTYGATDSAIYIWRTTGHFVESLAAHSPGCVNAVAWSPRDPCLFASAGDDKKVKMYVFPTSLPNFSC
jgi:WD40 repeat protein